MRLCSRLRLLYRPKLLGRYRAEERQANIRPCSGSGMLELFSGGVETQPIDTWLPRCVNHFLERYRRSVLRVLEQLGG